MLASAHPDHGTSRAFISFAFWLIAIAIIGPLGGGQARGHGHVGPSWPPPLHELKLTRELNEACRRLPSRSCGVRAVLRNDHVYVYPERQPAHRDRWDAACLRAPHLDGGFRPGIPVHLEPHLQHLPSSVLATWVAANGSLSGPAFHTVTFCGFRLDDVLMLDWSATEARVRFDLVEFAGASLPPLGTIASRGQFSGGLSVDRSTILEDLVVEDGHFGAFVEIERSLFHGTLRAKNTRIEGALRLRHNKFETAVRLEALSVDGDTIISNNRFPSHLRDRPSEPDGTSFSVVRLRELRLGGVLEVVENWFLPAMRRGAQPTRSLYLQKSTIRDNDVTIHRNVFAGQVYLIELEGKKITVSQNIFDHFFELSSSNVYSFRSFGNRYLGPFSITSNRIESSLLIDADVFDETATRLLDVRHNRVGHDLRFAPKSWPAANYTVDLGFNDVVGPFSFYWPLKNADGRGVVSCDPSKNAAVAEAPRWRGEINLIGTKVATSMWLVERCLSATDGMLVPITQPQASNGGRNAGDSAEPATIVDLTLVETGVLYLDLPANGLYAWRGKGLSFGFFGAPNQGAIGFVNGDAVSGVPEDAAIKHLEVWLDHLERLDPEVLFYVSDYLRSRGQLNASRDWLEKAKRVNYRPDADDPRLQRVADRVVYAALWPACFGAKPERVIWCMLLLWLFGTVFYNLHHRGWINAAATFLRRLRDPLPPGLVYHQPEGDTESGPELRENPRAGPPLVMSPDVV